MFGPESTFVPPKDPVDRKLHRLINHTIKQVARNGTTVSTAATAVTDTMDTTSTDTLQHHHSSTNPMNGIVVHTTELSDDVSLATTAGEYNSTVSSDSGGGNTNTTNPSDLASIHSLQTDAAVMGVGKKVKSKKKNIRFLFQRSNSLPDNLFQNHSGNNTVTTTIDTVTEEMDTTDHT